MSTPKKVEIKKNDKFADVKITKCDCSVVDAMHKGAIKAIDAALPLSQQIDAARNALLLAGGEQLQSSGEESDTIEVSKIALETILGMLDSANTLVSVFMDDLSKATAAFADTYISTVCDAVVHGRDPEDLG